MNKKKPEFGKRGSEKPEQAERKPSVMQRLKNAGSRWWGKDTQKKKPVRAKGFRR